MGGAGQITLVRLLVITLRFLHYRLAAIRNHESLRLSWPALVAVVTAVCVANRRMQVMSWRAVNFAFRNASQGIDMPAYRLFAEDIDVIGGMLYSPPLDAQTPRNFLCTQSHAYKYQPKSKPLTTKLTAGYCGVFRDALGVASRSGCSGESG